MGEPNAAQKNALRRQCRRQRAALLPAAQGPLLAIARRELPDLVSAGRRLGIHWPLAGEPDLRGLEQEPGLRGRLALPRLSNGALHYRAWGEGTPLSPDDTGIPAPDPGPDLEPQQLALLLVPALACDRQGFRLGYGGGWFDRLRSAAPWRAVPALVVLPEGCLVEQVPRDPWDVPFDGWLHEGGLHWLRPV
ncbi:MAG: 5-formyltetrahydrofolate cyclo-ligase [Synechococcaceae bacterium WBB_10_009]|nr:5-formyltetrahydrofolate cyclo-ligase [Synechococcaceae bacterium WBB_10_009]